MRTSATKATGVVVIVIALFVGWRLLPVRDWLVSSQGWIRSQGVFGGLIYGAAYVAAALLFVPGVVLTVSAGFVFGLGWGTVIVSVASTTAATLAFVIARHLARARVAGMARRYETFSAIDRAIEANGWKVIGLLRLSPLVPFSVSNYLYGLTSVRLVPYVVASWFGMLPATALYVALGAAGRTVSTSERKSPLEWIFLAAGLLATVAVTVIMARGARAELGRTRGTRVGVGILPVRWGHRSASSDLTNLVKPAVSMIVPVRDEAPDVVASLTDLALRGFCELIIVDSSRTPVVADSMEPLRIHRIAGAGSRGAGLAKAVSAARGDVFFFVHADSRPPENAIDAIRDALAKGASSGSFSIAYANADWRMRWVAAWANLRSRLLRLPFGDQGIFCRREAYHSTGGFLDMAVCEDVDLVRRLRRTGRFVVRPEVTTTSARRYRDRGAFRQVLRVWIVLAGYYAGVSQERLGSWYYGRRRS